MFSFYCLGFRLDCLGVRVKGVGLGIYGVVFGGAKVEDSRFWVGCEGSPG